MELAESLPESHWRCLARVEPAIKTEPRERPENVKEQIVRERGFVNQRLESEQVARAERSVQVDDVDDLARQIELIQKRHVLLEER